MYIKWNITKKCSMKCKFCHNKYERANWDSDLKLEAVNYIINNLKANGKISGVTLLGGEPTECQFFFEICELLKGAPFSFGFITSGKNLHYQVYEKVLLNENLSFIGFSVDSLDPKVVHEIKGDDILSDQLKSINKALEMNKIRANPYKVSVNTILMKNNSETIIQMMDLFFEMGVDRFQILEYNPKNGDKTGLQLDLREEMVISEKLFEHHLNNYDKWSQSGYRIDYCHIPEIGKEYYKRKYNQNLFAEGNSNTCPVYRDTVFVANYGGVYPCDMYKPYLALNDRGVPIEQYHIDNIHEISLDEIVNNEFFQAVRRIKEKGREHFSNCVPCKDCKHLMISCFPCVAYGVQDSYEIEFEKCIYYRSLLNE